MCKGRPGISAVEAEYNRAFEHRKQAAHSAADARRAGDPQGEDRAIAEFRAAQKEVDTSRKAAFKLVETTGGEKGFNDTNYIFLSFVTRYLPVGHCWAGDRGDLRGDHVGEFG